MISNTDRGQAFTLEGFVGAMIILIAVLFALQAAVITPSTGGAADRSVQAQTQQEAQDALVVANHDGNLSETLRTWDDNEFAGNELGPDGPSYTTEEFSNISTLGEILNESFVDEGWSYTLELHYPDDDGEPDRYTLVNNGQPPADAVSATHTVVLYDDDKVMPERQDKLKEAEDTDGSPIDRKFDDDGNPVYNTVEVRLLLW